LFIHTEDSPEVDENGKAVEDFNLLETLNDFVLQLSV